MEPNLGIEVLANLKGCPTDIPFFCALPAKKLARKAVVNLQLNSQILQNIKQKKSPPKDGD